MKLAGKPRAAADGMAAEWSAIAPASRWETSMRLSVVICTHNPHPGRLRRVLERLRQQTLDASWWELVLIDNGSDPRVTSDVVVANGALVQEPRLGLTHARKAGVEHSNGEIIVFVDDDNLLDRTYLENVKRIAMANPALGAFGGKLHPVWEDRPPDAWVTPFLPNLALRDFGESAMIEAPRSPPAYPGCAPVGAGMAVRRRALGGWLASVALGRSAQDRTGGALASGGDNDIVLHCLEAGYSVGYFPELSIEHIIPGFRLTGRYHGRLAYGVARSWVNLLNRHGITPWRSVPPATAWLRKLRLYFVIAPWRGPARYVRWRQACGQIDGRADAWTDRRGARRRSALRRRS
jgi:glycosyltransferase involved in cell wall biosynthesis